MADETQTNSTEVQQAVNAALNEQKKKKKQKKWIIIGVIAILLIIVATVTLNSDDDNAVKVDSSSSEEITSSNADAADETEVANIFKKGDVIEVNDLKISFTDCDADWTDYSEYWAPESGNKIIKATFTFENIGSTDTSLNNFDCYADDILCDSFYGADDYSSPALETLSSGRKFNAIVYFEVPENAENIVLEYETNYWSSKHIEFVIE